jgi:hypothetical protein
MNIIVNALCLCLVIFCTTKMRAMSYITRLDGQDLPITGSPEPYSRVYIANLYDDYSHIHPLRCKKDCKHCTTQRNEQTKAFARKAIKPK